MINAFSLNMVSAFPAEINVREIPLSKAQELAAGIESAVGHPSTAAVFSTVLGAPVAANRMTISLSKGETVLVGQYRGPRLPEGAVDLPEGATIQWLLVSLK